MLRLQYAALSDVGRVRRDNQDSGYAGPWLLTVCDGVGGAARGDVASSTAVQQLRKLDEQPGEDLLGAVAGALHRAHDRIAELVDEDPALNGTSTTATVALFDGARIGLGHVGDSRAYLLRDGELSQLTTDHTFVQSLIDEGRITEAESRVHPHRNIILKALDGVREAEPDLFVLELVAGDRLLLCSDGASGVLDDPRLAAILGSGTPDFAAVELVRASLEAGSSDNVTCIVADVLESDGTPATDGEGQALQPQLVGAAAELRRRPTRGPRGGTLFRGNRSGDTGELDPVPGLPDDLDYGIPADPVDPEEIRYAPRPPARFQWLSRLLLTLALVGLLWIAVAAAWSWTQQQYYVAQDGNEVVIFRGVNADLPGISLSEPYETTNVDIDRLPDTYQQQLDEGMGNGSLDDARKIVENLVERMDPAEATSAVSP
ncbi:protein phosphatase 2C domain-containing protein [Nocardioides sp. W7]|uniref:PP2C family protein-serine/threonine phosphatase n=1 Tax=Nocardioides sp. W7 TaxID=2931390 RepID=UPI001FD58655|nr:protein phosphatase 2C domain-containing protein [Nocardioides sp. W7]